MALLDGRAELAVHSLKDVPMELPEGFELAAVMTRADPRDALVSVRYDALEALPADAVVGTSSLRRAAQLKARFPGFRIEPLRGNLDTRLGKLDAGQYDAVVLAAAGLTRLGLAHRIRQYLDVTQSLPAPGQGMLGIEIRAGDEAVRAVLAFLNDPQAALIAAAERAVSRQLGGNCKTPLAAYGQFVAPGRLQLDALLAGRPISGTRRRPGRWARGWRRNCRRSWGRCRGEWRPDIRIAARWWCTARDGCTDAGCGGGCRLAADAGGCGDGYAGVAGLRCGGRAGCGGTAGVRAGDHGGCAGG